MPVFWPSSRARVDLPAPPEPTTATRFTRQSLPTTVKITSRASCGWARGTAFCVRDARRMRPQPSSHLRIARPSRDLDRAERFWIDGLGLDVLYRTGSDAEGGHALLMLGWPQAAWHLELVGDPDGETPSSCTDEDLLVLYVGGPNDEEVVDQLVRAGGQQVAARNPYWDRWGITIVDPDGYRLVLSDRSWP